MTIPELKNFKFVFDLQQPTRIQPEGFEMVVPSQEDNGGCR